MVYHHHTPEFIGFKYNVSGDRSYSLCKTSTYEKFPASHFLVDKSKTDEQILQLLVHHINTSEVGSSCEQSEQALSGNCQFSETCLNFIRKFRRVNLKAMLDYHCPSKSNLPIDLGNLLKFLKSIFYKSGLIELTPNNANAIDKCLMKCISRTKTSFVLLGELMQEFEQDKISWLKQYKASLKSHLLAKLVSWIFFSFVQLLITSFFTLQTPLT